MSKVSLRYVLDKIANTRKSLAGKVNLGKCLSDSHSKRKPRPCGITVHVAQGCSNSCLYCYIQDMGFSFRRVNEYPLNGLEVSTALIYNDFFVPTIHGTYIAIGSVCEPFLNRRISSKTVDYIYNFAKYLGNPTQFSTKMHISEDIISKMKEYRKILSPLITIVTFKWSSILEPRANPPETRLETIKNLSKNGFKVFLFLRPLIPGVTDVEAEDIMKEVKRNGCVGVVIGGFRVTTSILERLKHAGINIKPIVKRLKGKPSRAQKSIYLADVKRELLEIAREKGLIAVKSACCALTNVLNLNGFRIPCYSQCFRGTMCVGERYCPSRCYSKIPQLDVDEIEEAIYEHFNIKVKVEFNDRDTIRIKLKNSCSEHIVRRLNTLLTTLYRRHVIVRR